MKGYFITGTDTGIGKSLVTASLLQALAARGLQVAGMKPIAAGSVWDGTTWQNEDVAIIKAASNVEIPDELRCPYLLREPASPHLAAAMEGIAINLQHISTCYQQIAARTDYCLVEGVGGFRVPLGADFDTADMAVQLGLPVILVVGMRLGCLNHALLTADAISRSDLTLAGWVANGIDPAMTHVAANLNTLKARLPAPLLGRIPHLIPADPQLALEHLDLTYLL